MMASNIDNKLRCGPCLLTQAKLVDIVCYNGFRFDSEDRDRDVACKHIML